MTRVNSRTDMSDLLDEVARGVVEGLGFGVAAIAQLDGDNFVMTTVAGPPEVRQQILGRRAPVSMIYEEFAAADHWGILRYVPYGRAPQVVERTAWIPQFQPRDEPDAWHPMDALFAPLYSATGELLGNMSVDLPPGNRIPDQQLRELLEMYVVQAGLAMNSAQQRERLSEQVRLGDTLKAVSASGQLDDLDITLQEAAERIGTDLGLARLSLRCYPEGDLAGLEHQGRYPAEEPVMPPQVLSGVMALRRAVAGDSMERGSPVRLTPDDLPPTLDPVLREVALQLHSRFASDLALIAPIQVGRELLGDLVMVRAEGAAEWTLSEIDAAWEIGVELGRILLNARLYQRERHLVAELQELDRYKGELIATISHELKTPLTSIIGHVELMEDDRSIEATSVAAIGRNAMRLNRLVENLLNYSRMQDKREVNRDHVDLLRVCETSLDLVSLPAQYGQVRVALSAPEGAVLVDGDADDLAKVVNNLVGNAVKYTRPGGEVQLSVHSDGCWAEVSCTDTGMGIAETDLPHLFSAFHRSSNPDALSIPGTGLGLAISRRIAQMHGGEIRVQSRLGGGSTFALRVPVQAQPLDGD